MIYNIMINKHDISTRGKFHSICPLCINTAAMMVYWKVDAQQCNLSCTTVGQTSVQEIVQRRKANT